MVLAVLARRAGHNLTRKEVYGATVGGMKINEPAADLALALSLASTATDTPLPHGLVIVGEVGLGGEVRSVPQITQRLNEAERLGFHTAIVPAGSKSSNGAGSAGSVNGAAEAGKSRKNGMQVIEVRNLSQALAQAFR